ncbi:MAG: class I SAM-dependent methyltransferase [Treponema sp.]|jgi:2-polyprenyl-3-methyl-5-hydroxy-6-metoxy-1,4-benzoquinol methylase|nr:class I SAM-dependent methyltransferase [Treponema sp.]
MAVHSIPGFSPMKDKMGNFDKAIFWNDRYTDEETIWGGEPSQTTVECEKIFSERNVQDILIAGIGYGRNGKYFTQKGYAVDGIEIAEEAIHIGKTFAPEIHFIKGDILNTNLSKKYDAVFCYDVMQLFLKREREIIVENCITHLKSNGILMLSCLSIEDASYGIGKAIEKNTFEIKAGLTMHFADNTEMQNIHPKLAIITLAYDIEKETVRTGKARSRIYGLYHIK